MVTPAGGWETVELSQGQAKRAGTRVHGKRGAWESTKYQLEGKLLFTKYRGADIEKEKKEQARVKYSL